MTMKRQVIVLDVTYDDQDDGFMVPRTEPARWDWTTLLDAAPSERIEILAAGPVARALADTLAGRPDPGQLPYDPDDDSTKTPERGYR